MSTEFDIRARDVPVETYEWTSTVQDGGYHEWQHKNCTLTAEQTDVQTWKFTYEGPRGERTREVTLHEDITLEDVRRAADDFLMALHHRFE